MTFDDAIAKHLFEIDKIWLEIRGYYAEQGHTNVRSGYIIKAHERLSEATGILFRAKSAKAEAEQP